MDNLAFNEDDRSKAGLAMKNLRDDQNLPDSRASMQTKVGKLKLLMWKNRIQRRRHWILFVLEILVPTGLMALAAYLRIIPESDIVPQLITENSTYSVVSENILWANLCGDSNGQWQIGVGCGYSPSPFAKDRKLFWGPPTEFTQAIVQKLKDKLNFNDEFLVSVSSNEELNEEVDKAYLQSDHGYAYYIGLFFYVDDDGTIPTELKYDLRLQHIWYTALTYPLIQVPGPRNYTIFSYSGSYSLDGYVLLQTWVDRIYISMVTKDDTIEDSFQIQTQMFPYPPYLKDNGINEAYGVLLPTFIVFSLILLSPTLIKGIVHDKETGVRELVRMMGMDGWLSWVGWFIYSFVTILIVSVVIVVFLKIQISSPQSPDQKIPGVLPYSDPFLLWIFIILYGISAIVFCFAISCFFNRPSLATTVGVLIWILSYYIPTSLMNYKYDNMPLGPKLASCLLPNMAMTWFFKVTSMFEGRGSGIQWDNLWQTGNPQDNLAPAHILLMLTFDILLFGLVTWYVDQVMPGEFGVPLPWYFPIQASYYKKNQRIPIDPSFFQENTTSKHDSSRYEVEPQGLEAGIKIHKLRKEFKSLRGTVKVAVDEVSLSCYKGQCTVLLGHNGAGKTTTMSVLTGVYQATSGYAEINGCNIDTDLKTARSQVGLCPQHNTLFVDLSVKEHLLFFARLKGLTTEEAKVETKILLNKLQLTEKRHQFGKMLSGGMKRKLCLAIALIGNSKIVILDEPSSGLDPESRRWVWDVLQEERASRTILVTTHHMEEADVLGDRVAIMSKGKVACCGSPLFLKKTFGDGYTLTVTTNKHVDTHRILETIKSQLPKAYLKNREGNCLYYILPPQTEHFPKILDQLTHNKTMLGVLHLGLYLTSMEQVFLSVAENDTKKNEKDFDSIDLGASVNNESSTDLNDRVDDRLEGYELVKRRIHALFKKKFIYSKRKWLLLVTQALIPIIVTVLCLAVDGSFSESSYIEPQTEMSLKMYGHTYSLVELENNPQLEASYQQLFTTKNEVSETDDAVNFLLGAAMDDITTYRENYITAASFLTENNITYTKMMYQSVPYHCSGIGTNLINNALLHTLAKNNSYSITNNNYPLPKNKDYRLEEDQSSFSSTLYSMTMPIALAFLTSSFLVFPLNERISKAKQIQLMTGTSALGLWVTSFLWDMLSYSISILLIFMCFMAFDTNAYFRVSGARGSLFLLLFLYGFGSIPMAYVFSFLFENSASGFSFLALINVISGMIVSTVVLALELAGTQTAANVIGGIFSFIPTYTASKGFKNIVDMANYNTQCDIIPESQQESLCESLDLSAPDSLYMPCCPQCSKYGKCFEVLNYLTWDYPGIAEPLLYLVIDGLFYFVLLFVIESGILQALRQQFKQWIGSCRTPKIIPTASIELDDDAREEEKVAHSLMTDLDSEAALVVKDLTKVFDKTGLVAVNGISFHVKKGECFGLLGVNGAGKTTTFRMLTGDESPTSGDARIMHNFLSSSRRQFLRDVGYCPQFDAIINELTGEEMLELMAGLRGVPANKCPALIQSLVHKMDLTECAKRPSGTFSGGNKRKLSTGMALIGQPPLIFLDEPTSGVDPASRRKVWEAVEDATRKKQSVILTSHSMDECENLCHRVVIMSKGTLRCAGTAQHLKVKFGTGYTMQVKISATPVIHADSEHGGSIWTYEQSLKILKTAIKYYFSNSKLADEHRGMLSYKLSGEHSWAYIFEVMESLKNGHELPTNFTKREESTKDLVAQLVEDYAVMDPSLEQVFLSFAREAENSKETY